MRRFPPPWTVEALDGGFKVVDANGQTLAYVYGHADQRDAGIAKALTLDRGSRAASPSCPSYSPRRQQKPPVGAYGQARHFLLAKGSAAATRSASWTRAPLTSHVGLEDRQLALATSWRGWRIALVRAAMLRFAQGVDTLARVFGTLWYYR
jgi:hypothetical protein